MALCKDCCARNGEDACLIGQTSVMLPAGGLGCALKESVVEQRMGISKPLTNADRLRALNDEKLACWVACMMAQTIDEAQKALGVENRYELDKMQSARMFLAWLRKEASETDPIIIVGPKEEEENG